MVSSLVGGKEIKVASCFTSIHPSILCRTPEPFSVTDFPMCCTLKSLARKFSFLKEWNSLFDVHLKIKSEGKKGEEVKIKVKRNGLKNISCSQKWQISIKPINGESKIAISSGTFLVFCPVHFLMPEN